jgi:hypothetical protein
MLSQLALCDSAKAAGVLFALQRGDKGHPVQGKADSVWQYNVDCFGGTATLQARNTPHKERELGVLLVHLSCKALIQLVLPALNY